METDHFISYQEVSAKRKEMADALRKTKMRQTFGELFHVDEPDDKGKLGVTCMCAQGVIATDVMGYQFVPAKTGFKGDIDTLIMEYVYPGRIPEGYAKKDKLDSLSRMWRLPDIEISKMPLKYQDALKKKTSRLSDINSRDEMYSNIKNIAYHVGLGRIPINTLNDACKFTFAEIAEIIEVAYDYDIKPKSGALYDPEI